MRFRDALNRTFFLLILILWNSSGLFAENPTSTLQSGLYDPNGVLIGQVSNEGEILPIIQKMHSTDPLQNVLFTITRMLADHERPYIYALNDAGTGFSLVFINTDTGLIEGSLPIGTNATDMTINYGEGKLYVTNWGDSLTHVVDLLTLSETTSLNLGTDVYKINAGRPGRIYYEEEDQWININFIDTTTGNTVGQSFEREGDGEIDPTGNFYYHSDNNISNAHIHKLDISTDTPVEVATSLEHPYGSRNLVLSGDGSRLFWQGYVYDADLNEIGSLGEEIYATTLHGTLAFGSTQVFQTASGAVFNNLPFTTTVMALTHDQTRILLFDGSTNTITFYPIVDPNMIFTDGFESGTQ